MAEDSDLERTEEATPRRREQAREEGQVPRSRELATFTVTMTGVAMLAAYGGVLYQQLKELFARTLTFTRATLDAEDAAQLALRGGLTDGLVSILPILGVLFVLALVTPALIGGWNLSWKAVEPKFSKINPLSGIKRIFSVQGAIEGAKAILKSLLIGGVATWVIWNERAELVSLTRLSLDQALARAVDLTLHTLLIVAGAMVLLVLIDVPFQLWQYSKNLRMTKEDVKKEMKESEGSPEVKGRIRQLQREAARRRMMSDVPNASVVITNPTHYAVALRYEDGMAAPKVIAKGSMKVAERIIELARENRVTILRAPPFARALYFNAEIGDDIPAALYSAAAQVLAYVFQLRAYEKHGGIAPVYPDKLPVPPDLDPQTRQTPPATDNRADA
ncbi:flagellar biosynthesis protein FlhB [Laribacter hongkongensis]|uniref:flagellar biosynthesis protein FlhB n=1 Tax=Laribacter hongkongensis TaxID=168471 RepID=UPI001EFE6C10|nr:flagellar biosynthesis protein FlhB [Laribacter hongkongensis]MCG9082535.1 flagellar type III secretion system protein FlhB [Laribacter hongkongensis]